MPMHAASKMDPQAREDASIRFYWSSRKKCWDVVVSGRNGTHRWTNTRVADTRCEIDTAAGWLLLAAVINEMESWLV